MLRGFRHWEGSPAPHVDERAQSTQGLNGAAGSLSERQAGAMISIGHPRRQTRQRPISQRDDQVLLTIPTQTTMYVHVSPEQGMPRIANCDGVRNVSSL